MPPRPRVGHTLTIISLSVELLHLFPKLRETKYAETLARTLLWESGECPPDPQAHLPWHAVHASTEIPAALRRKVLDRAKRKYQTKD